MAFNIQRFFDQNGVAYATGGSNVSKGNVAIHCPFCGPEDEGQHLSVSLIGRGWRCFRRHDHRGKSPVRLVRAVLNCTTERAQAIVGDNVHIPDDFAGAIAGYMTPNSKAVAPAKLRLLSEFMPFAKGRYPSSRPFMRYLMDDRGFTGKQIDQMSDRYGMRYDSRGAFKGRIIFPVEFEGKLVSWTGRSIHKSATLRYKALSDDPERAADEGLPQAHGPISHYLLWYDDLLTCDADTICMCEGPFDALKIDMLGYRDGVVATCFFTSGPTDAQIDLLHELLLRFKRRYLLLDRGTTANAMRIMRQLVSLGVEMLELPHSLKDPGEFHDRDELMEFLC